MQLNLKEIIGKLKAIEKKFNSSDDPTERYVMIQALNKIAEKDLPIHGYWENTYYDAMLKKNLGEL
jgi:serine kinase of HPr protein (carbohydrate metabolism regulator)